MRFPSGHNRAWFVIVLALGLLIRIVILFYTQDLETRIADEQHYVRIADNIVTGNGFATAPGTPTSIRPPLYPAFVAAVWTVGPMGSLQAVRVCQILLALATTWLVYRLGARLYDPRIGRLASALFWLYPSFIFVNFLILTETLFTFLLATFVLSSLLLLEQPRGLVALVCGVSLGLSALTRSVLWPMPVVFCPLIGLLMRGSLSRRIMLPTVVFVGYALVIVPWAVRNTRVQGVTTIVDTMGGINLRMGNYEYTPDDRMWDAVMLTGEQNWFHGYQPAYPGQPVTEGMKDKWAQRKAFEYMREHPGQTIRRSFIKFADFWGLEREFVAGVQKGLYAPPLWLAAIATVSMLVTYVFVVTAGVAGLWLAAPRNGRAQVVVLLPALVILAGHTLAFGHSRYHLPLVPLLGVYAAALVMSPVRLTAFAPRAKTLGAAVSVAALLAIWIRQVALVDLPRIKALFDHLG